MREVKVTLGDSTHWFKALINDGEHWNGWLMPYIPFSEIADFANDKTNEYVEIDFTNGVLKLYDMDESFTHIVYPQEIEGVLYYYLGDLGYCFEEYEETFVESNAYMEDGVRVVAIRSNHPFESADFDGQYFFKYITL
jgi:hypothetical protein